MLIRKRWRLLTVASLSLTLSGCAWLWGRDTGREHNASTPLVSFLYANGKVPPVASQVELHLPIRVGVSFLPEAGGTYNGASGASAIDRDKVLTAIRERFKSLSYVSDIEIVPSYYLKAGQGDGLEQIEQLSQLNKFDLFALVSYDQMLDTSQNSRSFLYLTIVGAYVVRGDRNDTHTLLDLAVIDPYSHSLVMRAGGTSKLGANVTAVSADKQALAQRARGFELATASLLDNFQAELTSFEARVKDGTAPVRVTRDSRKGGGGALDPGLLTFLALLGAVTAIRAWRGRRSSAIARW